MDGLWDLLGRVAGDVAATVAHNWPFLLMSVVAASVIQVYVGTDRLAGWLRGRRARAVVGAVGLGALTPFCSCGTTAVVLGAMASAVPWAPLVAFMVSSPLTSPSEYVLSVGLFGPAFATTFFVAAIVIGLAAGAVTTWIERCGVLDGLARIRTPGRSAEPARGDLARATSAPAGPSPSTPATSAAPRGTALAVLEGPTTCCTAEPDVPGTAGETDASTCRTACGPGPDDAAVAGVPARRRLLAAAIAANARRLAAYFLGFAALGYLLIELIPTQVLTTHLGGGSWWSVPLAATLGVPVYLSTEGSLPLVASLMDGGMGPGAALAFLVTGAGTSVGALIGMLVIARWRVVALVVASLWVGALVLGYLAPLWL